jgi:hypothetical protein
MTKYSDAIKITKKLAMTTATDKGAMSVWMTDRGSYMCESYVYHSTVDSKEFTNINDVIKWTKAWKKKYK